MDGWVFGLTWGDCSPPAQTCWCDRRPAWCRQPESDFLPFPFEERMTTSFATIWVGLGIWDHVSLDLDLYLALCQYMVLWKLIPDTVGWYYRLHLWQPMCLPRPSASLAPENSLKLFEIIWDLKVPSKFLTLTETYRHRDLPQGVAFVGMQATLFQDLLFLLRNLSLCCRIILSLDI